MKVSYHQNKWVRLDIHLLLPSHLSVFLGAEATIPSLTPWPSVFGRILQITESPPSKINLVPFLLSLNFLPWKTQITRQEK